MARKTLDDLLKEEDDLGLLDVKPSSFIKTSSDSIVEKGFEEINQFIDRYGHLPGESNKKQTVTEHILQIRLQTYRDKKEIIDQLRHLDRHNLFVEQAPCTPQSLDEILDLDDELLNDPNESIFTIKHVNQGAARPQDVANRTRCQDFEQFKPIFDKVASQITSGERKTMRFANEQDIEAGGLFILKGVMVYVAEVNDPHVRNGKKNARLRIIFENGTEGRHLLRSLARELYKDPHGRRISEPSAGPLFGDAPLAKQVETGYIYVVRSMSSLPEITRLDGNLFKIGFTSGEFEDRIRNAKDDPTFLMAPVYPVRTYKTININANKFENLMHRFFGEARLNITIQDRFGKPIHPREWFLLPLELIEEAIDKFLDGSIVHYQYDHKTSKLVKND
jgi:Meiotically up-regulated gene 113